MQNSSLTCFSFTVAPKSTSTDLLSVSAGEASTTPQSHLEEDLRTLSTDAPHTAETSSGSQSESQQLTPSNLTFSASSTNIRLAWEAPEEAFDHFWVQVTSPTVETPVYTATVPGYERDTEIEGLLPLTQYEITLHGLVDGKRSLPLNALATTGT